MAGTTTIKLPQSKLFKKLAREGVMMERAHSKARLNNAILEIGVEPTRIDR